MLLDKKNMSILEQFSSDYSKRIYGRDTSKRLKMNQKTASNILKNLEKENILKFSQEGKNKYYYLNKFNPNIKEIIKIIEINKKMEFLQKYKELRELFESLEKRAYGVLIIFGSYAQGTGNKKSDLDVFIMGKISDINNLEKLYNIRINVVKSTPKKFENREVFIREIIKNHIVLKGVEEFTELIH